MTRGGPRPGAGRPVGATDARLSPEATAAALDGLCLPDETDAGLARRLGVARQTVSRARAVGVTERQLRAWRVGLATRR